MEKENRDTFERERRRLMSNMNLCGGGGVCGFYDFVHFFESTCLKCTNTQMLCVYIGGNMLNNDGAFVAALFFIESDLF